jgi:hypothetical protein
MAERDVGKPADHSAAPEKSSLPIKVRPLLRAAL